MGITEALFFKMLSKISTVESNLVFISLLKETLVGVYAW